MGVINGHIMMVGEVKDAANMRLQRDASKRRAPEACRSANKMKKVIPILAITCLCVYAVLTIWDVTINGFFESPSLNATHFIAGAGKTSLLVRYGLAAISVLSLMIWILLQRELKPGLAKIVIAIVVVTSLM